MEVPKKQWTTMIGQATGHPAAFGVVLLYALLWLVFDAVTFDWNAVATLGVWMMTLFIQRRIGETPKLFMQSWMNFCGSIMTREQNLLV
jgi:hypothetical protein